MNMFSDKILSSKNISTVLGLGLVVLAIGRLSGRRIFPIRNASERTARTAEASVPTFQQMSSSARQESNAAVPSRVPATPLNARVTESETIPTSNSTAPAVRTEKVVSSIQISLISPALQIASDRANNGKKFDFVKELIPPVLKIVGSCLAIKDIAACFLVSRKWNGMANLFGEHFAQKLGCAPAQLGARISQLKQIVSENRECLNQRIMTAQELNMEALSFTSMELSNTTFSRAEYEEKQKTYFSNVNAKLKISERLEELFNAQFTLAKLGLVSWEQVENIANVRKEKCGSCYEYQRIAVFKAQAGDIESALTIAQQQLDKYAHKVFYEIVGYHVDKNLLQAAYAIYSEHLSIEEDYHARKASTTIWNKAQESNNYDILEKLIDLYQGYNKIFSIQNYIELLIENGVSTTTVREKVTKYKKDLDYLEKDDYSIASSIQIYVQLGFYNWATELTTAAFGKVCSDTPEHSAYRFAWHILRNAYSQCKLEAEAQRIQEKIDAMEKAENEK